MLHRKYNFIQEHKTSAEKDEYKCFHKKGDENKGVVEHGNNFIKCKIISDKNSN